MPIFFSYIPFLYKIHYSIKSFIKSIFKGGVFLEYKRACFINNMIYFKTKKIFKKIDYMYLLDIRQTFFTLLFSSLLISKDVSGLKRYETLIDKTIKELKGRPQQIIIKNALKFVKSKKVIRGSCWDYINAIYKKSGVKKRIHIFRSKKRGPYAKKRYFKSGDWVYHINHSYHNIGHSGKIL